ncbi:hypothetical protein [Natronorubrum sp. DTA7]|uniref:hypothetical protein n=1 Tax=Natronorubrum sp. DTA7 TaxID=3447016 RepID=UPI003F854BD4
MTVDEILTTDDPLDDELTGTLLTGATHLEPAYRPEWENSNPDWEDGQILLEGELDFPADQPAREVAASLRDRAETIGAVVDHDPTEGEIRAYPWNGPGHFRLNYNADDPAARVASITVFDGRGRPASHDTLAELKDQGEVSEKLKAALFPADSGDRDDGEEPEVHRITMDGLVPISDE